MDEIIPGLFLGDIKDAHKAPKDMVRICVLEYDYREKPIIPNTIHIPVLVPTGDGRWYQASEDQLTFAAKAIDHLLRDHQRVLVHCWAGEERSPLTVAWYLHLSRHITMDEAYKIVKAKRPQITRRDDDWLPSYLPKGAKRPKRKINADWIAWPKDGDREGSSTPEE